MPIRGMFSRLHLSPMVVFWVREPDPHWIRAGLHRGGLRTDRDAVGDEAASRRDTPRLRSGRCHLRAAPLPNPPDFGESLYEVQLLENSA